MPFGKQDETVFTQAALFGGTRNEVGQIDPASGELLKDRDQTARLIGSLIDHQGRPIMSGWRRDAMPGDHNKTGLVPNLIFNPRLENFQSVTLG